tara:strand:- start:8339 stop:8959 length:621 start_codon:yes stop_codon:yes gene_type:complete
MKYTETDKLVYEMLTENTGSHMLDSGGAYGRHWERNQKKTIDDFSNEEEENIEKIDWIDKDGETHVEYKRTVSVFHFLSDLQLDDICDEFNRLNTDCNDWEGFGYGVSERASDYLKTHFDIGKHNSFNTYNGDSDLSQILQGAWIELDDEQYLLLQIHNGCDARGGYTDAKLFKPYEEYQIHEYLSEYKHQDEIIEDLEHLEKYSA